MCVHNRPVVIPKTTESVTTIILQKITVLLFVGNPLSHSAEDKMARMAQKLHDLDERTHFVEDIHDEVWVLRTRLDAANLNGPNKDEWAEIQVRRSPLTGSIPRKLQIHPRIINVPHNASCGSTWTDKNHSWYGRICCIRVRLTIHDGIGGLQNRPLFGRLVISRIVVSKFTCISALTSNVIASYCDSLHWSLPVLVTFYETSLLARDFVIYELSQTTIG